MEMKLPITLDADGDLRNCDGSHLATLYATYEQGHQIVAAVNSHKALLAVCEEQLDAHDRGVAIMGWDRDDRNYPRILAIRAAVALAKGGA